MSNVCPYCGCDYFENDGYQGIAPIDSRWRNKCKSCGKWSAYNEQADTQEELLEPEKTEGQML